MQVWIVRGSHAWVPGEPLTIHATLESANREAASLVCIMLADCKLNRLVGSTSARNWQQALRACNETRDDPDRMDFDIWITKHEVEGT